MYIFLFYKFWRCLFFLLADSKVMASYATWATKRCFFSAFFFRITLFFKIILPLIISLRFLFLFFAIIGISWNHFSLKYRCLSMISLMFGRVLLNFSTCGILCLFAIFGFEVNKASLVTSNILLNWSVRKFYLQPRLTKDSFNSP